MLYTPPARVLETLSPSNQFFGAEVDEEAVDSADCEDVVAVDVATGEEFAESVAPSAPASALVDEEPSST